MTDSNTNVSLSSQETKGTNTTPESVSNASISEIKPVTNNPAEVQKNSASIVDLKPVQQNSTAIQSDKESKALHPETRPHAFVVMPFGKKKGADNQPYDFNIIYNTLIKPALEEAGFESFRADEETSAGDILTDMFQELLLADLVICDLSIDNANAFYELGIRHALRKRGVVHIQAGRAYMPFDIFNVRTLPYHITPEGVPDPAYIRSDIKAISRMVKDTWASDRDAVHSPIYNMLSGLKEPDRKSLQTPLATGFWREYNEWREKVNIAQRQKHIGDILLLTEEIRNPLIREEAIGEVGRALANLGRNELALTQYRKGIEVNSSNLEFRREEAFHLNRIGRVDEAIVKIENILTDFPNDSESITYLGRIYKEMWTSAWKKIREKDKRLKYAFDSYHWLIKSIDIYMKGFQLDLNDYYPGINAFTLSMIVIHLVNKFGKGKSTDPDIARIRKHITSLQNTLIFGLESKMQIESEKTNYWMLISYAELKLLTNNDIHAIVRTYRKAITASRRNLFFLYSSLSQLEILRDLGMRAPYVNACINLIQEEIRRVDNGDPNISSDEKKDAKGHLTGGRNILFTGYMVDYTGKEKKTLPPENENELRQEIRKKLEKIQPTHNDRAFVSGLSAGSEIIFAEVCLDLGLKVKAYLPHTESAYVREFISPAGEGWADRFYKIRNHPLVDEINHIEALGQPKEKDDLYERNNRWALYSALGRGGIENMRLIAVANETVNSRDRDVRLAKHMIELMRDIGGVIEFINPSKYIYNVIDSALESLMRDPVSTIKPSDAKALMKKVHQKKD